MTDRDRREEQRVALLEMSERAFKLGLYRTAASLGLDADALGAELYAERAKGGER